MRKGKKGLAALLLAALIMSLANGISFASEGSDTDSASVESEDCVSFSALQAAEENDVLPGAAEQSGAEIETDSYTISAVYDEDSPSEISDEELGYINVPVEDDNGDNTAVIDELEQVRSLNYDFNEELVQVETSDASIIEDVDASENDLSLPAIDGLMPMKEEYAYLLLNGFTDEELRVMPITAVLDMLVDADGNQVIIPEDATVVWAHFKDETGNTIRDEYHAVSDDDTVDLSEATNTADYLMDLIVGNGKQLGLDNIRYIVRVYISDQYAEHLSFSLYSEIDDVTRKVIEPKKIQFLSSDDSTISTADGNPIPIWGYVYYIEGGDYRRPHLSISSDLNDRPDMSIEVYEISQYLENNRLGYDLYPAITDQIVDQDLSVSGTGYRLYETEAVFMVLYYIDGVQRDAKVVYFAMAAEGSTYSHLEGDLFLTNDPDGTRVSKDLNYSVFIESDVETYEFVIDSAYSADSEFFVYLNAISGSKGNINDKIVKVVEGQFDDLDEVTDKPDVKADLFGSNYTNRRAWNLSGDGKMFTIFFQDTLFVDTTFFHVILRAVDDNSIMRSYTDAPIVGEEDPWFRVTGASQNGKQLDTYVVENGKAINMDTMYGYGYQTIIINNESVDLSKLQPVVWVADPDRVKLYVDGQPFYDGKKIDCTDTVRFTAVIDGHQKNYQVRFVKKIPAAKLYVVGPQLREVFLDEYFEYKHDIFIANVGKSDLTGLTVELNAANCRLDDYWTVGGSGNDVLPAFTETSSDTSHEEPANIAKIRLLPDGEGEIEGTLTVSADGQQPVVITLTGQAQNPRILTSALPDAVQYVPYSCIITTSNMYDWTDVTFTLTGNLPEGVNWYPDTGEIYGVPTVDVPDNGYIDYPITIEASFTSATYEFESSSIDLTLRVQDNTNENVFDSSDAGYSIEEAIGTDVGGHDFVLKSDDEGKFGDELFRSEAAFGDFQHHVYLNGQELTEGIDYSAESGSTVITVYAQAFENKANTNGSNTIAAEFRVDGERDNELRRTAQNFRLEVVEKSSPTGWVKSGSYWYYYQNGVMLTSSWAKDSSGWCYLGSDGRMLTNGWAKGTYGWCYMGSDGHVTVSKWIQYSGNWYYLNSYGLVATNTWAKDSTGWCYLGSDGRIVVNQWVQYSGVWYYMNSNGYVTANAWVKGSSGWYYLGSNGRAVTNAWVKGSYGWCYLKSNGLPAVNEWIQYNGAWYYLNSYGYLVTS